jgi:hypothetical protein
MRWKLGILSDLKDACKPGRYIIGARIIGIGERSGHSLIVKHDQYPDS